MTQINQILSEKKKRTNRTDPNERRSRSRQLEDGPPVAVACNQGFSMRFFWKSLACNLTFN